MAEARERVPYDEMRKARARRKSLGKSRPRGVLPYLPADAELLPAWLTAAFRPPKGFEFEKFNRASVRKSDPCSLTFHSGRDRRTFRFDRQVDLHGNGLRSAVVGITGAWLDMPHLTANEIEDVWVGLCKLAIVMSEYDVRDEATKWMHQDLDECASPLTGKTLAAFDGRHDGLMAIRRQGEFVRRDAEQLAKGIEGWQRRPMRFIDDQTGEQYIRSGEFATFLWHVIGERGITRGTIRARLSEIGVEARYFEAYQPPHPKLTLFQLTDDLIEYVESMKPEVTGDAKDRQQSFGDTNERGERTAR